MSPSKGTSRFSVLPPYTPMIPSIAPEPTLSNMLGSVMSAVGLQQGPSNQAHNVHRFPTHPVRRPYSMSDDQQGSGQEIEGPRGEPDTSAKPFGAVQCMTGSTSMFPSPVNDYRGPPTDNPKSIRPKLTVAPTDDHTSSRSLEASEASGTPPLIGPDATTVRSLSGVITFAPDASQTVDESPKPPITDSPPLPPNTVTAMFATPTTPETTQDITSVVTRWSSTPNGDTYPPTSTYTRWEDMTQSTLNTTARTDPVDYNTVRTRHGDMVHIAGQSEVRTCDTGPTVTSNIDPLPSTGFSDADDELSDDDDRPAVGYFTDTPPETIFTLITTETINGPIVGAASPDSMWLVAVETGTITETTMIPTQGVASPDSMWSVAVETAGAATPDSMWSVVVETGTVTETEVGMGGGMSTVAASTVFATPAVRVNDVGVADTQMQAMGIMAGNIVALMAGLLMLGAFKSMKKA